MKQKINRLIRHKFHLLSYFESYNSVWLSLDQYNYNDVDFIKIDVEGWEPKVLRGAKKTIDRCNPVICVEINKGDHESQWLLESWGYELKEVDHLQGHDFIFVREDWEPE